jgi:hypothetical protein
MNPPHHHNEAIPMEPHRISTRVPVDTRVGQEMVIFRSSRFPYLHDGVEVGQIVTLYRGRRNLASGRVTDITVGIRFRDIAEDDIRDGYFAGARTRGTLLSCMRQMYPVTGYDENTPTTVIRCLQIG